MRDDHSRCGWVCSSPIWKKDICHLFWTDTIESMSDWDNEQYAAIVVKKLFIPRGANMQITIPDSIENYELFSDSHIPDISSTEIRRIIPEYVTIHARFAEDPKFIIPGILQASIAIYSRKTISIKKSSHKNQKSSSMSVVVRMWRWPIIQLRDEYDIICFWYPSQYPAENPSMISDMMHSWRYVRSRIFHISRAYDVGNFFTRIKGVEHTPERGEKCTYCYDMRMMVSAKLANRLKIPLYTSSLNTSPKKDLEKLFKMGHLYAKKYGRIPRYPIS